MTRTTDPGERIPPITAPLGTPEYEREFREQSVAAAETALRQWAVRIPCGIFAVSVGMLMVEEIIVLDQPWWRRVANAMGMLPVAVELAGIALRGRSVYLRQLLDSPGRGAKNGPTKPEGGGTNEKLHDIPGREHAE